MLIIKFMHWLFFIFCYVSYIGCSLENHLKKADGKTSVHRMPNIDFIYMINLDERPEKWERSCKQLEPYGITPYRFSAVNGWNLSLKAINEVGVKFVPGMVGGTLANFFKLNSNLQPQHYHEIMQNYDQVYFCHGMAQGAIGIVLSHLSVLQDGLESGYETIWVMEDDIEVHSDPRKISDLIDELDRLVGKSNWDVLFTDKDTRDRKGNYVPAAGMAMRPNFNPRDKSQYYVKKEIGKDFIQTGARFGAYSMIIRKSGIEKIVNFIKLHKIFLPYDLDYYLPVGIKMYTVKSDIVGSLINALSDNGAPYYLNKLRV